jgi:hypothetical protein
VRLGCFGCAILVVVGLIVVAVVAVAIFLSTGVVGAPEVRSVPFTKNDGYAAQQKLFEITRRQSGASKRKEPLVLTEAEATAFLSRHMAEDTHIPLSSTTVHFEKGQILLQGQTSVRKLLQAPGFAQLLSYLPGDRLDQPVWVTVRGRIAIQAGAGTTPHAIVSVTQFDLGRQPIPSALLSSILGRFGPDPLRWPVPSIVTGVDIEEGRALIQTR